MEPPAARRHFALSAREATPGQGASQPAPGETIRILTRGDENVANERLAGNLSKMAAIRFLSWTHLISSVLIPFFREWGRLSFTTILVLQAWFMFWSFLLEVPTGAVADRFGRRISIAAGGLIAASASLLYASAPRLSVFLAAEWLFACAVTLFSGADEALVYDTLKALGRAEEATRVISRLESFKLAGIVCGALAGGLVAARAGVRAPMLVQALPLGMSGLLALSLAEPPTSEGRDRSSSTSYAAVLLGGMDYLRRNSKLLGLVLDMVFNSMVAWLILWLYQPQLQRVGIPLAAFGAVHAGMSLAQITLLARVDRLEGLLGGRRRLWRVTSLIPALCYFGLSFTISPALSIGLILLTSACGLARPPLFSGEFNKLIPSERRATVLSAISAARTLCIGLIYPAIGAILDRSLPWTFLLLGFLGLAAAIGAAAPEASGGNFRAPEPRHG